MMRGWRVVDLPFIRLIGSAAEVAASSRENVLPLPVDRVASTEYFNDHYGSLARRADCERFL